MSPRDATPAEAEAEVQAAGGLVLRRGPSGGAVLLIHRPKYDDWSFAKGKLIPGEDHATAALREVREETGLECLLGRPLPSVRYRDRSSRVKEVRYWVMYPKGGTFAPNSEVDRIRWAAPDQAAAALTYEHDRDLMTELTAADWEAGAGA